VDENLTLRRRRCLAKVSKDGDRVCGTPLAAHPGCRFKTTFSPPRRQPVRVACLGASETGSLDRLSMANGTAAGLGFVRCCRVPTPSSAVDSLCVHRGQDGGWRASGHIVRRTPFGQLLCPRLSSDSMTLVSWTRRRLRVDDAGQHEARDRLAQWRLKGPWQACKRACPFPSGVTSPLRQRAAAHRRRWEIRRAATPCPVQSRHAVESCMKSFAAYGIAGEAGESTLGWPGLPPAASLWASCVGRGPTAPRD
jgi:hypothetical protein